MTLLTAAIFLLSPMTLPVTKLATDYRRIELWVPTPGTQDYEWHCLQDRNQPSLEYTILSCTLTSVETFDIHGRATKAFLSK